MQHRIETEGLGTLGSSTPERALSGTITGTIKLTCSGGLGHTIIIRVSARDCWFASPGTIADFAGGTFIVGVTAGKLRRAGSHRTGYITGLTIVGTVAIAAIAINTVTRQTLVCPGAGLAIGFLVKTASDTAIVV
jgi:hypothetical protein